MIFDIDAVEKRIGYTFKDKLLLRQCFTHASYAYEHKQKDNEILEFFGDSIMEFVVTEYLCEQKLGDEGELTRIRAEIVSKTPLQNSVKELGLDEFLLMSKGLERRISPDDKAWSSIYEAVVAGIYYDGGLKEVRKFVRNTIIADYLEKKDKKVISVENADAKNHFQEYVQKNKIGSIAYELLWKKGPDHAPEFKVAALLNGRVIAYGEGASKKIAEARAAETALKIIKQGGIKQ